MSNSELVSQPLKPLPIRALNRIVVFGGNRLGDHVQLSREFQQLPIGQVSYPRSLFEAGICVASASIVIFDMAGTRLSELLACLPDIRAYCPRATVIAVLEPKVSLSSMPDCGLDGLAPGDITLAELARYIETLRLSPACQESAPPKSYAPDSTPGTEAFSGGFDPVTEEPSFDHHNPPAVSSTHISEDC